MRGRMAFMALVLVAFLTMITVPTMVYGADDEANAVYGSTPNIDGTIDPDEWTDADNFFMDFYVKQDGVNLYFAFDIPDYTYSESDFFEIFIDVNGDKDPDSMSDDIMIGFDRSTGGNETAFEYQVDEWGYWVPTSVSGWTGSISYTLGWQLEFSIPYTKVNVVAGAPKNMSLALVCYDYYEDEYHRWPAGALIYDPSLWGTLYSTPDNWIPEFPTVIILPLFMLLTLLATVAYKRKHYTKSTSC